MRRCARRWLKCRSIAWRGGPGRRRTPSPGSCSTARANIGYAHVMEHGERGPRWQPEESPSRQWLLDRLDESAQRVQETFEWMTPERLRQIRADRWGPLGPEVPGPLDALWFALQM